MTRSDILNQLLRLYFEPAYLEIGVEAGTTFFAVSASKKVAVDPAFKFPVPSGSTVQQNTTFHPIPSDEFFATAPSNELFDVIFIDGLHTFEQTLRDFINATQFGKPQGVIVIDDVRPSSYYASLPNLELSVRLRTASGEKDGDWMGDVYKLVYFIETFFQQYDFATVAESPGQLVVWKKSRPAAALVNRTVEWISRVEYAEVALDGPYHLTPLQEIARRIAANAAE